MIYVDEAKWPYRGALYCHMMTDGPIKELHDFARMIGMQGRWFQDKPSGKHYDLSPSMRRKAVMLGAVEVTTREMLRKCSPHLFKGESSER